VYLTGTTTKATIYKDGSNTPQDNPFTANTDSTIPPIFAAINIAYDVNLSGGIPPNVYNPSRTLVGLYPSTDIIVPPASVSIIAGDGISLSTSPCTGGNCTVSETLPITSFTATDTSGEATLINGVLNIPQYQAAGNYLTLGTPNQTVTQSPTFANTTPFTLCPPSSSVGCDVNVNVPGGTSEPFLDFLPGGDIDFFSPSGGLNFIAASGHGFGFSVGPDLVLSSDDFGTLTARSISNDFASFIVNPGPADVGSAGFYFAACQHTFCSIGMTPEVPDLQVTLAGVTEVKDSAGNAAIVCNLVDVCGSARNLAGGVANDIPYQTGAGATSFVAPVANAVLVTNGSGVPSESTTLPSALMIPSSNLTGVSIFGGTPTSSLCTSETYTTAFCNDDAVPSGGGHMMAFLTTHTNTIGTGGYSDWDDESTLIGQYDHYNPVQLRPIINLGSGKSIATTMSVISIEPSQTSGLINNYHGIDIESPSGSPNITQAAGIFMGDICAGVSGACFGLQIPDNVPNLLGGTTTMTTNNYAAFNISAGNPGTLAFGSYTTNAQIWDVGSAGNTAGELPGTSPYDFFFYNGTTGFTSLMIHNDGSLGSVYSSPPSGACSYNGAYVLSQTGLPMRCNSGTWGSTGLAAASVSNPITSATGGIGTTGTPTCLTATCTNLRGTYSVAGGTFTTGTFLTLVWPTTTTAYVCTATMNGGTGFLGIGNSVATATGMNITAGVTIAATTVTVNYSCQP